MKEQLISFFNRDLKDHPASADLIEHLLVYHGDVAEELATKANRFGCEAIVLGCHRGNLVKRFFPGGIEKKILNQTQKPILIVSMEKGQINVITYNE